MPIKAVLSPATEANAVAIHADVLWSSSNTLRRALANAPGIEWTNLILQHIRALQLDFSCILVLVGRASTIPSTQDDIRTVHQLTKKTRALRRNPDSSQTVSSLKPLPVPREVGPKMEDGGITVLPVDDLLSVTAQLLVLYPGIAIASYDERLLYMPRGPSFLLVHPKSRTSQKRLPHGRQLHSPWTWALTQRRTSNDARKFRNAIYPDETVQVSKLPFVVSEKIDRLFSQLDHTVTTVDLRRILEDLQIDVTNDSLEAWRISVIPILIADSRHHLRVPWFHEYPDFHRGTTTLLSAFSSSFVEIVPNPRRIESCDTRAISSLKSRRRFDLLPTTPVNLMYRTDAETAECYQEWVVQKRFRRRPPPKFVISKLGQPDNLEYNTLVCSQCSSALFPDVDHTCTLCEQCGQFGDDNHPCTKTCPDCLQTVPFSHSCRLCGTCGDVEYANHRCRRRCENCDKNVVWSHQCQQCPKCSLFFAMKGKVHECVRSLKEQNKANTKSSSGAAKRSIAKSVASSSRDVFEVSKRPKMSEEAKIVRRAAKAPAGNESTIAAKKKVRDAGLSPVSRVRDLVKLDQKSYELACDLQAIRESIYRQHRDHLLQLTDDQLEDLLSVVLGVLDQNGVAGSTSLAATMIGSKNGKYKLKLVHEGPVGYFNQAVRDLFLVNLKVSLDRAILQCPGPISGLLARRQQFADQFGEDMLITLVPSPGKALHAGYIEPTTALDILYWLNQRGAARDFTCHRNCIYQMVGVECNGCTKSRNEIKATAVPHWRVIGAIFGNSAGEAVQQYIQTHGCRGTTVIIDGVLAIMDSAVKSGAELSRYSNPISEAETLAIWSAAGGIPGMSLDDLVRVGKHRGDDMFCPRPAAVAFRESLLRLDELVSLYPDAAARLLQTPFAVCDVGNSDAVFKFAYPERLLVDERGIVSIPTRSLVITTKQWHGGGDKFKRYLSEVQSAGGMVDMTLVQRQELFRPDRARGARQWRRIEKNRRRQGLVNMIKKRMREFHTGPAPDCFILMGDSSPKAQNKGLTGFGAELSRVLARDFLLFHTCEFRSSVCCAFCRQNRPKTQVAVGRHSAFKHLSCTCESLVTPGRFGVIVQRDKGACDNMIRNALDILVTGRVDAIVMRPTRGRIRHSIR